ncbi:uncharacterized protein LOC121891219 isoform X7 [Thunnus maccoyii]|uniref:uncharacterized protein LOC121891219 isoform X7 n=1 Tax=Thunnus maccoyii TaxID=8240 RepID=UPI001C4AE616|nr:uncharacterized protein LOC121891219 isoform X7 [Thunnus maccoyii]
MVCVIFDFFKSNCRVTGAPEKKSILKYPSEVCATSQNVHGGAVLSRCGDFGSQGCDFTPLWHVIGQFKTQVLDSSGRSLLLSVRTQSEKKSHSLSTHEWVVKICHNWELNNSRCFCLRYFPCCQMLGLLFVD